MSLIPFKKGIHGTYASQFHTRMDWEIPDTLPNPQGSVAMLAFASSMSSVEVVNEKALDIAQPKSQEGVCMKWDMKEEGGRRNGQWEIQDPKVEVLYHIRPYFLGIFPYIGLIYGRYLQFRFLKWPLKWDRI